MTTPPPGMDIVSRTLAFFASVIKSGESWTPTCQAEYEAAQEALTRLRRAAPEWREISTAPKDGTLILGGDPRDGHREPMWWADSVYCWCGQRSGFWKLGAEPPLWVPIPVLPPSEQAAAVAGEEPAKA